jgi:hypothetical protein
VWRTAADDLNMKMEAIAFSMQENGNPHANVAEDWIKDLKEDCQAKERAPRQVLARSRRPRTRPPEARKAAAIIGR